VTWDELNAALLELIGERVTIDLLSAGTPIPIAGLQGVLVNVTEGHPEDAPNEQWSMGLRVRSEGSSDTSYLHVVRPAFRDAAWAELNGRRSLQIHWHNFEALVVADQEER
jgi:hypothetical protein